MHLQYICQSKELGFFLQDAECTILCNHIPLEKFKRQSWNNKVNNWFIELCSYKLKIQLFKGTKNVLANCLSRLANTKQTDHNYEPKGQEFGCTIFEEIPPTLNIDETMKAFAIDNL